MSNIVPAPKTKVNENKGKIPEVIFELAWQKTQIRYFFSLTRVCYCFIFKFIKWLFCVSHYILENENVMETREMGELKIY